MKTLVSSLWTLVVCTALLGFGYPVAVTALAQMWFPFQAGGSLVGPAGAPVASSLIGQDWPSSQWFQGRPSATAGQPYNPQASGGSNLSPQGTALADRRSASAAAWKALASAAGQSEPVPDALLSASGSGLDPDLDLAAALWQVPLVAHARNWDPGRLEALVRSQVSATGWPWDPPASVNVVGLNRALAQGQEKS